jgi:methyltransferase-like protein
MACLGGTSLIQFTNCYGEIVIFTPTDTFLLLNCSCEHIDEKIHNDEIEDDEPVILSLSREHDNVSVAANHLELSELALALKSLHGIGVSLIDLSPKSC